MDRAWWRSAAATWGSAAWLVLQQFGVPSAPRSAVSHRIVHVQEAEDLITAQERLPDGRILTVPLAASNGWNRQDSVEITSIRVNLN